jgi:nucleotide-binding universal stress UspA family protein
MTSAASALDLDLKSVLLATDLSSGSATPLHQALSIARHYKAKLYIAHIVSAAPYLIAGPEALEMGCESACRDVQQFDQYLRENGSLNGLDCEFILRRGCVCEELRSIISQKQIGLVVLGTHGRRGLDKLILGSVAEQVFREAECPVLTIGPHSYREGRLELANEPLSYVYATDFSEASLTALPHAISFATRSKARLILLHVLPTQRRDSIAFLSRLTSNQEAQIEIEFVVQFGMPAEKILQVALEKKVDLIILGLSRARLVGVSAHRPLSTAYEIVCGAACPVLTLRS